MRKAFFIVVLSLVVAVACCPCRQAGVATAVSDRDNTYHSHHDIVRITIRDTMILQPLAQFHNSQAIPLADAANGASIRPASSFLENDYCTSTAEVDENGILRHTLDTRDSAMLPRQEVTSEREMRDTLRKDREVAASTTIAREVRKVTWWQRTQIVALWSLLGILAIAYRKKILSLVKRILPWI